MKVSLIILIIYAICSQMWLVENATIQANTQGSTTTSTAKPKPWTSKVSDGLGKFFHGVGVASAVSQSINNSRGPKTKLNSHTPSRKGH